MPLLDFDALTDDEAKAYLDGVVARHPAALTRLSECVAESGDDPSILDGSPESLQPLWRWYLEWWGATGGAGPGRLPAWWVAQEGDQLWLPVAALERVELLGHYLADVTLRAVPGSRWIVVRRDKRQSWEDRNKPAVAVGDSWMLPFDLPYTLALRASKAPVPDDALLRLFHTWTGHAMPEGTM